MFRVLFFLCFPLALLAQHEETLRDSLPEIALVSDTAYLEEEVYSYEAYSPPPLKPLSLREIPAEKWDKATGGLDYSKDLPKAPKERKKRDARPDSSFGWGGLSQGWGTFLQVLAILFALAVIGYGIYWMMQMPSNRAIARDGTEITLANLDEYIHETDLEKFLREALLASNWPLAVRLYFLQIVKHLSEKEAIAWSKEKTNRDYLREMRSHQLGAAFREITRQYERVWYGNQALSAEEFASLEPGFKDFLTKLGGGGTS